MPYRIITPCQGFPGPRGGVWVVAEYEGHSILYHIEGEKVTTYSLHKKRGRGDRPSPVDGRWMAYCRSQVVGSFDDWQIKDVVRAAGVAVPAHHWYRG